MLTDEEKRKVEKHTDGIIMLKDIPSLIKSILYLEERLIETMARVQVLANFLVEKKIITVEELDKKLNEKMEQNKESTNFMIEILKGR